MTVANHQELGRRRGVWVPEREVQAHLAFGWEIVALPEAGDHAVLMRPAQEGEKAA